MVGLKDYFDFEENNEDWDEQLDEVQGLQTMFTVPCNLCKFLCGFPFRSVRLDHFRG